MRLSLSCPRQYLKRRKKSIIVVAFFTIVLDHQEWETQKDSRRVDNKFSFTDDGLCFPEYSAGRDHPAAGNSNLDTHKRGQDWERCGI